MTGWREYSISDFLQRIKRPVSIDPDDQYSLLTIKLYHKGIIPRGLKSGSDIKAKTMFVVNEGDFILSGIDARNGAFGIVPNNLDGAVVTNDFWYFKLDENIIDKQCFLELTKTNWFDELCKKGSDGTTNRIRLQKDKFFNQVIPLPSIKNQIELREKLINLRGLTHEFSNEIQSSFQSLTQLRQAILQLAVQGKLTEAWRKEHPDVESASVLLKKIKVEKQRLVVEKKIKKEKPLPPITEDEIPFELPDGWAIERMRNLSSVITCGIASTPTYVKEGRIFLSAKNVKPYKFLPSNHKFVSQEAYEKITKNAKPEINDILLTRVGAGIGEACLINSNIDFAFYVSLTLIKPIHKYIDSQYLLHWLSSPQGIQKVLSNIYGKGVSQGNLNVNQVRLFAVTIPPLEEQQQIVSKVNQLMQLCDELEEHVKQSKEDSELLMQAVLKEAFEGK